MTHHPHGRRPGALAVAMTAAATMLLPTAASAAPGPVAAGPQHAVVADATQHRGHLPPGRWWAKPRLGPVSVSPARPALGTDVTFTTTARNADRATWAWTLRGAGGKVVARSTQARTWTTALPTDRGQRFTVEVTVRTSRGSDTERTRFTAQRPPSVTVTIEATSIEPQAGDITTIAQQVTGTTTGPWVWAVTRSDGTVVPVDPQPAPGQDLDIVFPTGGLYTVTLTVTDTLGRAVTGTTNVFVYTPCAVTSTPGDIDLVASGGAPVAVRIGLTDGCPVQVPLVVEAPDWLSVPTFEYPVYPGQEERIDVTLVGTPPSAGRHVDAVVAYLDGERAASWDVITGPVSVSIEASSDIDSGYPATIDAYVDGETTGPWVWTVTRDSDGAAVPFDPSPPGQGLTLVFPTGGLYTATLTVTDTAGTPVTATTKVFVYTACAIVATPGPIDFVASGGAPVTVEVGMTDGCPAQDELVVQAPDWLSVPTFEFPTYPGHPDQVTVGLVGDPPFAGTHPDAVVAYIGGIAVASWDVVTGP